MSNILTTNVTEWAEYERPDMSKPYEVISSPAGETVRAYFATEAEALAEVAAIAALSGTYSTSWGEQDVNTSARVIYYVIDAPTAPAPVEVGSYVRVSDESGVVGGGIVTAIDSYYITVNQPYAWRYNGVVTERGYTPSRYSVRHTFQAIPLLSFEGERPLSDFPSTDDAYNYARIYFTCVYDADGCVYCHMDAH